MASASLKPMARQLLENRTPAAYQGVEAYARKHAGEGAGSLAWLAAGYAYFLDHQYANAIDRLRRARAHAGEIGDYVAYYLANAYFSSGRSAEARATLVSFDDNFPESVVRRDAHVLYAGVLVAQNRPQDAVRLLEKDRQPIRADLELALARAYLAANDNPKAVAILRNLYFNLPLSFEASVAQSELERLRNTPGLEPPSFTARKMRADELARARRFQDAAAAYRELVSEAPPGQQVELQLALAETLHYSGQNAEAKRMLNELPALPTELGVRKLYDLAEIERSSGDEDGFLRDLAELRQAGATSSWLEQALLYAGNIYLLRRDYDRAIDAYRELEERFPRASRAAYAHWKVAWLSLRQDRVAEAKSAFDEQIALYPESSEVPAALYWRARLAEEDGDSAMARAYYQKIAERFPNYYYGPLAQERQAKLGSSDDPPHYAILDRVPPLNGAPAVKTEPAPEDNERLEKVRLLENGGLLDFAVRELRTAAEEEKGNWLPYEMARLYEDAGRYDLALETVKHAVPNYFALDLGALPQPYWEALFPRPYWPDVRRFSSANGLDPYLVASLIRQESEFNPNAVSVKNALGLMQLLPRVGKGVAKQVKRKHFSPSQLFVPTINLELGTRYFRSMVDEFGGFEYALAAYNAGDDRVRDWRGSAKYRDIEEFVESIPFTETREYVEAIMRNAHMYRLLYGTP